MWGSKWESYTGEKSKACRFIGLVGVLPIQLIWLGWEHDLYTAIAVAKAACQTGWTGRYCSAAGDCQIQLW